MTPKRTTVDFCVTDVTFLNEILKAIRCAQTSVEIDCVDGGFVLQMNDVYTRKWEQPLDIIRRIIRYVRRINLLPEIIIFIIDNKWYEALKGEQKYIVSYELKSKEWSYETNVYLAKKDFHNFVKWGE
jgi:hypothetical protein